MKTKCFLVILFLAMQISAFSQTHTSYLWHLQQPNYWADKSASNPNRYQTVKESNDMKFGGQNNYPDGQAHPLNDLQEIFSKQDRVNIYQHGAKNSVSMITWHPEAGAQVNYSGCLIENVNGLAAANQWGYYPNWANNFVEARGWQTSGGFPRLDIVGFTFHHALSPLISERAFTKELKAHRLIYGNTFGTTPNYTKGYFPAECCFTERNIKILVQEGFEWSIVANSHLARTMNDYPLSYGTNACNIDPPNKADKVSTNGTNWWSGQIDGRGGTFAAPYCYQAHKAKYIDPETGTEYKMDVIPMADLLSYRDGYSPQGTGEIQANIQPYEDPAHPTLVLFAHDGDNAWGGGSAYYTEAVPGWVSAANNVGIVPTTIQQFLNDHPVPANDVVHVEDGGWVNASSDWGHPQFINWLWPLYNPSDYTFNPDGWTEDARNWAVITAIDNFACMAEDLAGGVDMNKIVYPDASSSNAEKAWHFYMPALTSGYMYYGKAIDMEVKQTLAGNNAIEFAQAEIDLHPNTDNTAPSVFIPQRFPYNPGAAGFGPLYGYQEFINSKDFSVWTYAFDVSGISTVVLKYRTDIDGTNPLSDSDNDTYAGGAGVSSWTSIPMTKKVIDPTEDAGDAEIDFFIVPTHIADLYHAEIAGLSDTLVDYYVEVTDTEGNTFKTAIQHVYVGGLEGGGAGNDNVFWTPTEPTKNEYITITATQAVAGSKLHWAVRESGTHWTEPDASYWPASTVVAGGGAVQSPFTDSGNGVYTCQIGPFNNAAQVAEGIDFVIKINASTWDNNGGSDYYFDINNVVNDNPTGTNITISMLIDESYTFAASDFNFQGISGATFAGIKIESLQSNGALKYNGTQVSNGVDYADVTKLVFSPQPGASGAPYASFTFKLKDDSDRYSDATYIATIYVSDLNPVGANASVTIQKNETYNFETSNFQFTGQGGANFAGIKIIDIESAGALKYNAVDVSANTLCPDVTLLSFAPATDASGNPYANFTFKVKDSNGNLSNFTYTFTINVLNTIPAGVSWYPELPTSNDIITVYIKDDAQMQGTDDVLHWGVNSWNAPAGVYHTPETVAFDGNSVETPFAGAANIYSVQIGPFNNPLHVVNAVDFVLHYGNDTWNNNSGSDWHIPITQTINVADMEAKNSIEIYPNPTENMTYIHIKSNGNYRIVLRDISGKLIKSNNVVAPKKFSFDSSEIEKGIYFLQFLNLDNKKSSVKKIIKL